MGLKSCSDEDLLEELSRRVRVRADRDERLGFKHCDECSHFEAFKGLVTENIPETFNPCTKGNTMSFRVPKAYGDVWGFYRRVCSDRARRPSVSEDAKHE